MVKKRVHITSKKEKNGNPMNNQHSASPHVVLGKSLDCLNRRGKQEDVGSSKEQQEPEFPPERGGSIENEKG